MNDEDGSNVQRILILRGGGLGDFVLTLPVLQALQLRWPGVTLELIANPEMAALAQTSCLVDKCHSINDISVARLFRPPSLPSGKSSTPLDSYDVIISFLRDWSGYLEANLLPLCRRLLFVDPARDTGVHATRQFLRSLQVLGIGDSNHTARLVPQPDFQATARHLLPSLFTSSGLPVAVHPGSGGEQKNWQVEGFAELLLWIESELGRKTLVVTGEADRRTRDKLRSILGDKFPPELNLPTLRELVSVLCCCDLLVGNDSGVSHLAAAYGLPVLAFFGPTSPTVWRPSGAKTRIVRFEDAAPGKWKQEITSLLDGPRAEEEGLLPEARP